jgi:hypothetical protein
MNSLIDNNVLNRTVFPSGMEASTGFACLPEDTRTNYIRSFLSVIARSTVYYLRMFGHEVLYALAKLSCVHRGNDIYFHFMFSRNISSYHVLFCFCLFPLCVLRRKAFFCNQF